MRKCCAIGRDNRSRRQSIGRGILALVFKRALEVLLGLGAFKVRREKEKEFVGRKIGLPGGPSEAHSFFNLGTKVHATYLSINYIGSVFNVARGSR